MFIHAIFDVVINVRVRNAKLVHCTYGGLMIFILSPETRSLFRDLAPEYRKYLYLQTSSSLPIKKINKYKYISK